MKTFNLTFQEGLIRDLADYNFDLINLDESKSPYCKIKVVVTVFQQTGTLELFDIDRASFLMYLQKAQYYYQRNQNPFHNFDHGITGTFFPAGLN